MYKDTNHNPPFPHPVLRTPDEKNAFNQAYGKLFATAAGEAGWLWLFVHTSYRYLVKNRMTCHAVRVHEAMLVTRTTIG